MTDHALIPRGAEALAAIPRETLPSASPVQAEGRLAAILRLQAWPSVLTPA